MSNKSNKININLYLNTLKQQGNLAYEYNPLYNFQTDEDLYIIDNKYIIPEGKAINLNNGEILTKTSGLWIDKRGKIISSNLKEAKDGTLWAKAGSLIDLDTEKLNFDLEHPVEIEVQPSYDGSVNLILNDDKNIPRLINSRFSVREKDTYEIVDRIGENDTNIYNSKTFDKDTSLYFLNESNPLVSYLGFIKGSLLVGLYCFYFTYCDVDDNESDFIAETGLIPVFIGDDKDPRSMDGGIKNLRSEKGISLKLKNLDKSYNYLKVYYVRYFADYNLNRVIEGKKILKKISINSNTLYLLITGYEATEDIDPNILNISRFNPKNVLTLALCKNMLFFGNIVKNTDNYKELQDLSLRIVPSLKVFDNFDTLNDEYRSESDNYAYYNSLNIYNLTGYFNLEYYRFGIVYIYKNGTLSNVYNTLGRVLSEDSDSDDFILGEDIYTKESTILLRRNYIKVDDNGWIKSNNNEFLNARGVCKFDYKKEYSDNTIFSIKFTIPENVATYLKEELGIRGFFFVRQKCIPNLIALCYLLPMDEVLEAPVLEKTVNGNKKYYTECFLTLYSSLGDRKIGGRLLSGDFNTRLYEYKYSNLDSVDNAISSKAYAGICPDFLLNLPYYNQIFNGRTFKLQKASSKNYSLNYSRDRFFVEQTETKYTVSNNFDRVTICSVTESTPTIAIKDKAFKLSIGVAEEAYRFKYAEIDNGEYTAGDSSTYIKIDGKEGTLFDKINESTNLVRGLYSPYLAIYSQNKILETGCLYNIYSNVSISTSLEFLNRMDSLEPFYTISDRYNLINDKLEYICWRGDCYTNQFTYRLVRNFNDPSLPNNDIIIDINTWKDNYDVLDPEKWKKISRSDINAVKLGSWITFKVRSAMNYALRSEDHSFVSEEALMGAPRSFYPKSQLLSRGENKMPDSYLYNDAYRASLGYKCYFTLQDVNYVKDTFSNRILYSAVAVLDSYKNNYRYSLSTYFRDYSSEYGSILKLVEVGGNLLVVFEHGIGLARINEKILTGGGENSPVFVNTLNVLPEELEIISDSYGTLWGDSVIKTNSGAIYGVDTVAKKIWRLGKTFELISDFKVNKFLIDNITLSERELYPTVGLRNVKTHYNANKGDVIFTFYDDVYKDEEKAWSLCYNELLASSSSGQNGFVTFYSWIPSYSANIDTKFFSFDRDTAKELALLLKSNYSILENTGVLVECPILKEKKLKEGVFLYYVSPESSGKATYTVLNPDKTTSIKTMNIEAADDRNTIKGILNEEKEVEIPITFKIEKDHWQNYKLFKVDKSLTIKNQMILKPKNVNAVKEAFLRLKVILLYITPQIVSLSQLIADTTLAVYFPTELIAITLDSIVENPLLTSEEKNRAGLTTDFYLHGLAGIFDVAENLYPTYWYGHYHPFEFEFIVNDKIGLLKLFENLVIISNKAEPESFHFEIEGDNYEFSSDKRNMYFRLEATKNLYLNLGSDILYNRAYTDVAASKYTQETYYRPLTKGEEFLEYVDSLRFKPIYTDYPIHYHDGLVLLVKSTIFPLYYLRIDTYNDIYHKYHMMHGYDSTWDFQNLSGSEITWNRDSNQFNIVTHIKNSLIDLVGRLRGNSRYKEGKWNVQIPTISFMLKNELPWPEVSVYSDPIKDDGPLKEASDKYCVPPIVINSLYVPDDLNKYELNMEDLPNIYTGRFNYVGELIEYHDKYYKFREDPSKYVDTSSWTYRKETKIRDKWMKVRIRYSGKNLAIIHSVATLYNLSYS